jgi:hypothetical protein
MQEYHAAFLADINIILGYPWLSENNNFFLISFDIGNDFAEFEYLFRNTKITAELSFRIFRKNIGNSVISSLMKKPTNWRIIY